MADIQRGIDELIVEALLVALFVIMVHERDGRSQERTFVKENHPLEALAFDRPHESLAMSIQVGTARRQPQGPGAAFTQRRPEGVAEFGVAIHDDEPLAGEHTIRGGQVAPHLHHPRRVRIGRDPRQMNPASRKLHHDQQTERNETSQAPDLDGEEVRGRKAFPET